MILANFDTDGASYSDRAAVNGIIVLGKWVVRGFRTFERY